MCFTHPLMWMCNICGEDRPDAEIAMRRTIREKNGMRYPETIRYCRDKPECIEGSKTKTFMKE